MLPQLNPWLRWLGLGWTTAGACVMMLQLGNVFNVPNLASIGLGALLFSLFLLVITNNLNNAGVWYMGVLTVLLPVAYWLFDLLLSRMNRNLDDWFVLLVCGLVVVLLGMFAYNQTKTDDVQPTLARAR